MFSSAQALHESLQSQGSRVGLSTVYRSLRVLAECGVLEAVRHRDIDMW